MARTAAISIWDAATRTVLVQSLEVALPMELGRVNRDGAARIRGGDGVEHTFGRGLDTLSRTHLRVTAEPDGGAHVIDESSNGVARVVPGQPPMHLGRNRREEMQPGASRQFETVGLVIEIALPPLSRLLSQPRLFATYASRSSGTERAIDITARCIALRGGAGEVQIEKPAIKTADAAMAATAGHALLAVIGPDARRRVIVLPAEDGAAICNRRALMAGVPQALEHLDTVEVGPLTLRILGEGAGRALICVNPECRQLNPHEPGGNCRYCGTRLGDAVTRMLPAEGPS